MLKYALFEYIPRRHQNRASFEQQETCRRILDFKDGRTYAKRWAAEEVARALSMADLKGVVVVCVPASCQHTYVRRFKKFSKMLCAFCGAADGFNCIEVIGHRKKAHHGAQRDESLVENVVISSSLQGRRVLLIDDIYTTGTTSDAFARRLSEVGADVRCAVFLGKTRRYRTA